MIVYPFFDAVRLLRLRFRFAYKQRPMDKDLGKSYVEVRIAAPVDCGELLGLLTDSESLGAWEDGGIIHLFWPAERWSESVRSELASALGLLGVPADPAAIQPEYVPDRDWNALWAESVQPIRIGRKILVRQSWNQAQIPQGGIEVIVDPKRAFGSGYHATTQLAAEWLEDRIRGGERMLDVGTGSGILAMAAVRLGASAAFGIDSDPVAIQCALENSALNGFGGELEFSNRALEELSGQRFDCVVANLDRRTLLTLGAKLKPLVADGGKLLITGLQLEDEADIVAAFSLQQGQVAERRAKEEWLALEIRYAN